MEIVTGRLTACRPGAGRPPLRLLHEMVIAELSRIERNSFFPKTIQQWARRTILKVHPIRGGSKGDTYENDLLKLLFNATAIANVADNAAASPLTALAVALHTADPGESGTQSTNETSYTGYGRVNINRNSGGWTVTGNSVSPAAVIDFGQCTAGSATITHASVGKTGGGATEIFYSGTVTPNIAVSSGVIPRLGTSSAITED